jgi:hypothetical protein
MLIRTSFGTIQLTIGGKNVYGNIDTRETQHESLGDNILSRPY